VGTCFLIRVNVDSLPSMPAFVRLNHLFHYCQGWQTCAGRLIILPGITSFRVDRILTAEG
jgi:hypothetical protein